MGIADDAKEVAETAARKVKEAWEDATDKMGDKVDEVKADTEAKKAQADADAVRKRNEIKEDLRD